MSDETQAAFDRLLGAFLEATDDLPDDAHNGLAAVLRQRDDLIAVLGGEAIGKGVLIGEEGERWPVFRFPTGMRPGELSATEVLPAYKENENAERV